MRPTPLSLCILAQAAVLLAAGGVTLWWSQDLMVWLIFMVGEERALDAANVIRGADGGKLLTNPTAMVLGTLPFWFRGQPRSRRR